jgi:tripartite-type tricarboxylate transporter receptor subunit TctC
MTAKLTRRAVVGGLGGLAGLAVTRGHAEADWPTRTITIIHGFPAGGPSDVVARLIADGLSKSLGQSVIVEARPGASGTMAAGQVARAAPDGYTLSVIPSGHASAAATFANLPYRSVDDFTTITLASEYPYVMATNADSGIKSVADLIATAKTRPSPLLYGTPGVGSGPHLAIELFALQTKIKVLHVPYRGSAPAVMELVGGRLDFMMDPPATMMEFIRSGKLRALAVSSANDYFALPATPTVAESGVPGFDVRAWQGLVAPAALPEPILRRLNAEVVRILKEPETVERMHTFGNEPAPSTPEEFRKRLVDDIAKWTAVAEQIHFEKI